MRSPESLDVRAGDPPVGRIRTNLHDAVWMLVAVQRRSEHPIGYLGEVVFLADQFRQPARALPLDLLLRERRTQNDIRQQIEHRGEVVRQRGHQGARKRTQPPP